MSEFDQVYDAGSVEQKWYARWLESGAFRAESARGGKPYTIVIPPPNVTGILHMGHALNVTIQDILIRWRRMQGRNALWVPGTDHAGIATQNVVERALRKEGKTRNELGRAEFVRRVWEWREQYGKTIIRQLQRLGASCDWSRERFTMDEGLSRAVTEVFVRLYNKQLIYRGNYIINWCPRCQTALSDEESVHVPTSGKLYYLRYLPENGRKKDALIVATTRPETLLGDVALAINPRDERYATIKAKKFILPILNRVLPVIEDDLVDPEFGTGVVKVTPAHDPNDFEMGRRHDLQTVMVMNADGSMNEQAGTYAGLDRFECRKRIVEDLQKAGLLEKIEDHTHAVGHCYRCDTAVEPRLSLQWFVRMQPLARPALEAVRNGRIQFVPERWAKVYLDWMENIRDWCISRQIWWGHRIPVFYCDACLNEWATAGQPKSCPKCGAKDVRQDEDVLDTWFSSWLWPFSVFGWPERSKELDFYYPTDTLVTGSEIIFFWVARMVMAGQEFMGEIPFRTVYIHGTVRDDSGRKMSKSLGNAIDPLEVIDKFSADALRFSLIMVAAVGQDIHLGNEHFEIGRNFLTKLRNAARFLSINTGDALVNPDALGEQADLLAPDDKHILARFHDAVNAATEYLERYRFNDLAKTLHEFVWRQFCDWYIEYAKTSLGSGDERRRIKTLQVMHYVLSGVLRLLHPIAPFLTEDLWHVMGYGKANETIQHAVWPKAVEHDKLLAWGISNRIVEYVEAKHDLVRVGRVLRADYGISPSKKIAYFIRPADAAAAELLRADADSLSSLLRAESLVIDPAFQPLRMINGISRLGSIFIPIEGVIDAQSEIKRLNLQLSKAVSDLAAVTRKLDGVGFVQKAPPDVIEAQRARKQELIDKCGKLQRLIAALEGQIQ